MKEIEFEEISFTSLSNMIKIVSHRLKESGGDFHVKALGDGQVIGVMERWRV